MWAILTGDIVNSTKLDQEDYLLLTDALKESFRVINELYIPETTTSFDIFRGDSFQGVIPDPSQALEACLVIRSSLRKAQPKKSSFNWDARTSLGIGTVDYLPDRVSEGTGEAYQYSGTSLDQMKTEQRLTITTPWQAVNNEMQSQAALLDAIIHKWSPSQAEVVLELLAGKSRKTIGKEFDISQAAVHYRIKGAGWFAIQKFIERYRNVITQNLAS